MSMKSIKSFFAKSAARVNPQQRVHANVVQHTHHILSKSLRKVKPPSQSAGGKCYLQIPTSLLADPANTRSINYVFDDDPNTTGIDATPAAPAIAPDVYYNLQGQRVDNPGKGLYIKNGKKVIVK